MAILAVRRITWLALGRPPSRPPVKRVTFGDEAVDLGSPFSLTRIACRIGGNLLGGLQRWRPVATEEEV